MLAAKLLMYRLLFGKFSFIYHQAYSRSVVKTGKTKNIHRSCSKVDALTHYRGAADYFDKAVAINTNKVIRFDGKEFGQSFRKIKGMKKRFSSYDVHCYGNKYYWRRLGYKERIFNSGVNYIYHFLDKEFFFGEFFFSDVRKVDVHSVAKSLINKYCGDADVPTGNFKIEGNDAYIFFRDSGINLSVMYIYTGDFNINQKIDLILSQKPAEVEGHADWQL